jgi:signal transduction histidine kinase
MKNEEFKILDSYNLVLSQIHISQLILQALREASEFKSDLMNIVAHDLKNPLNSINGFTALLEEYIPNNEPEANEFFQMIKQSTQHMLDIVLELLNSTVIESGKMELKKSTFDLCDLMSAVIYQNKALAGQKEQIIKFNFREDEDFICFGDSLKIRETIDNLVNNAVKYSNFKTNITVDLEKKNNLAIICIVDQGQGFSPEDLSKVFGKFQRLSAKPTGNENSTGLGLYIVKQIIDLHKGNINIESKENVGSKITIELPIIEND